MIRRTFIKNIGVFSFLGSTIGTSFLFQKNKLFFPSEFSKEEQNHLLQLQKEINLCLKENYYHSNLTYKMIQPKKVIQQSYSKKGYNTTFISISGSTIQISKKKGVLISKFLN